MSDFRLPDETQRLVAFGRTGSGKTVFLVWNLSMASITDRPWIIFDHKNDKYLGQLPRVERIKLGELPKHPGVYIVRPTFNDDEKVDAYLHAILAKGNIGVFTDEGASIPQAEPRFKGLKSIFAQGRSKRTPILFATQKPFRINMSVLSEGDYYATFHLQFKRDIDRVREFMPDVDLGRLDEYHSRWYDVKQNAYFLVKPVNEDDALQRLDERLKPRQKLI